VWKRKISWVMRIGLLGVCALTFSCKNGGGEVGLEDAATDPVDTVEISPTRPPDRLRSTDGLFKQYEIPTACRDDSLAKIVRGLDDLERFERKGSGERQEYLLDLLSEGVRSKCIDIMPWFGELIEGQKGVYYQVTLKAGEESSSLAVSGASELPLVRREKIHFSCGKYTIPGGAERLKEAVQTLKYFQRRLRNHRLYVRGSADQEGGCAIPRDPAYNYTRLSFIPQVGTSQTYSGYSQKTFGSVLFNNDLPILRAAFVKDILSLPVSRIEGTIELIEGEVSSTGLSPQDRHATIFLFGET